MRNFLTVKLVFISVFFVIPLATAADNPTTQPKSELVHPRAQIEAETVPVSSDPKQIQDVISQNKQNLEDKDTDKSSARATEKKTEVVSPDKNNQRDGGNSPSGGPGGSVPTNVQNSTVNVEPFSGSANMAYPIQVPPGRGGIQPNLALTYSSSFRSLGLAGIGWTMDLGSIQLSTKKGPPKYDGTDIVTLIENGSSQDLVYDSAVGFYRTEVEGAFAKIQKVADHWEVTDKKGVKYYFGNTDDSRSFDPANQSHIFRWALNRVEDLNGDYMTMSYLKDQGQLYPQSLAYTGNSQKSLNTYAQILFNYEDTGLPFHSYMEGFLVKTSKRISSVNSFVNGINQVSYNFIYQTSTITGHSRLSQISECRPQNVCLPPVIFNWQDIEGKIVGSTATGAGGAQRWSPADWSWRSYEIADVNGDGFHDFISFQTDGVYVWKSTGTGFAAVEHWSLVNWDPSARRHGIADINGDGKADLISFQTDGLYVWISTGSGLLGEQRWSPADWSWRSYEIADVNGDGFHDFISFQTDGVYVWKSTGTGFAGVEHWSLVNWDPSARRHGITDINGDGKADLISFQTDGLYVWISTGSGLLGEQRWSSADWSWRSYEIADMNGDGLSDFISFQTDGVYVWKSTGKGFDGVERWSLVNWDPNTREHGVADINGDGKFDLLSFQSDGLYVWLSTGVSLLGEKRWSMENWNRKHSIADMNGDGKGDFISLQTDGLYVWENNKGISDLLKSTNNSIGVVNSIDYEYSTQYENFLLPFSIPVVKTTSMTISNPIGAPSTYTTNYHYAGGKWNAANREFQGFQAVKVIDTQGNYSQTTYLQDHWLKGRPLEQSTYDAQGVIQNKVVNQWQTQDITTHTATDQISKFIYLGRVDNYLYDGVTTAKRTTQTSSYNENPQYGNVTQTFNLGEVDFVTGNDVGNDTVITTYEYTSNASNWLIGLPKYTSIQDSNGNTLGQLWLYYDGSDDNNAIPSLGRMTKKVNWLGSTSQSNPVTKYAYDVYGNLLTTTDPNGNVTSVIYDNEFHMFPVQTTNVLGQTASKTYYGVAGQAQDGGLFGQVKSNVDANNQTVLTRYDTFGRPIKVISSLDTEALPTSQKIYQVFPTYTSITSKVRVDSGLTQTIDSVEYYDGLGRLIEAKTLGPHPGQYIVSGLTEYDYRGLPIKKYLPRFTSNDLNTLDVIDGNVPFSQVTYDSIGRVVKKTDPDGSYSTLQYDHWTTTSINENGHMQKSYVDASGRLIKKEEYLGADGRASDYPTSPYTLYATTNYTYDPLGRLISVKDAQNNVTTIQYDRLGRKISMSDLDMGNWQYSYDANNNMIEQTDAKGKKIRFTYDALNRLINKAEAIANPTFNVNYAYDQVGQSNSVGRLGKVDYNNGTAGFVYDQLGREVSSSKNIDGKLYRVNREYDLLNRIKVLTYPSGQQIKYLYNQAGQVISIGSVQPQDEMAALKPATEDPNQILLALNDVLGVRNAYGDTTMQLPGPYVNNVSYNALGQITQIQYANGVSTAYTYNPQNQRLTRIYTSNSDGERLQDLSYIYDALGQITSITDAVHTATQQYKYDALNRLIYAQGSYGIKNYAYDSVGNITQKDGLTYAYGEPNSRTDGGKAGPHAVTSLSDGTTFKYDLNGNMVTIKKGVDTTTYLYDVQNRLIEIDTQKTNGPLLVAAKYYYDGDGGRTKKVVNRRDTAVYNITGVLYRNLDGTPFPATNQKPETVTTRYIGNLVEDEDHGTTGVHRRSNFIYMGNTRVAAQANDNVLYYHNDYLGGANVLSDQAGLKRDLTEYDPFGLVVRHERYGKDFATIWSGFTSKNLDDESGLMFYGARYYNPKLGRFITADTIVQAPDNPQTLNRYTYCNNNPVNNIDPSGHSWFKKFWRSFAGAAIGAFIIFAGPAAWGLTLMQAGILGGAIGGAVSGGLDGGFRGALIGGLMGGVMGGVGGWARIEALCGNSFGNYVLGGMAVGGIGSTAKTGNWASLAGSLTGSYLGKMAYNQMSPNSEQSYHFSDRQNIENKAVLNPQANPAPIIGVNARNLPTLEKSPSWLDVSLKNAGSVIGYDLKKESDYLSNEKLMKWGSARIIGKSLGAYSLISDAIELGNSPSAVNIGNFTSSSAGLLFGTPGVAYSLGYTLGNTTISTVNTVFVNIYGQDAVDNYILDVRNKFR